MGPSAPHQDRQGSGHGGGAGHLQRGLPPPSLAGSAAPGRRWRPSCWGRCGRLCRPEPQSDTAFSLKRKYKPWFKSSGAGSFQDTPHEETACSGLSHQSRERRCRLPIPLDACKPGASITVCGGTPGPTEPRGQTTSPSPATMAAHPSEAGPGSPGLTTAPPRPRAPQLVGLQLLLGWKASLPSGPRSCGPSASQASSFSASRSAAPCTPVCHPAHCTRTPRHRDLFRMLWPRCGRLVHEHRVK